MPKTFVNDVQLYHESTGAGTPLVLTHGSWTDGSGWSAAIGALGERGALDGAYEVVTWDRRGHSRSSDGDHPGSRDEDAEDLAALIETLGGGPVHLVGNSYGSIVVLTVVATRPDLVASAIVHEPPILTLPGTAGDSVQPTTEQDLQVVVDLIEAGEHRAAAEHFIENVALGPGSWANLPEAFQEILETNAPTYLDESRDPTSSSVDIAALAATSVPLLLTHGTASPAWFGPIVADLARLVPTARVATLQGAGHIPHVTHPDDWATTVLAFHESVRLERREAVR